MTSIAGSTNSENAIEINDGALIPQAEKLTTLAEAAQTQLQLEAAIENAEAILADLNKKHKLVSQTVIPKMMQEIGMSEFKLSSGAKLTVTPFYAGKITSEEAYDWLKVNGHGSMVKSIFEVPYDFGASEEELETIYNTMDETGLEYTEKKSVHHMTLGAFIKEQDLLGTPVPTDLFNVYTGYKTKIK